MRELRLVELTAELPRPRDHWRRLRFLVDQARAFCDAGGHGLGEFVQWATDQTEEEADALETVVPEADDDAVRILIVHGSKGFEFPVTIVAGLGVGPRTDTAVVWAPERPEVRVRGDWLRTRGFDAAATTDKALGLAEQIRLLYVAMTRAQDHLVLGCHHKPVKSKASYGSHAQHLWRLLADGALATVEASPLGLDLASPPPEGLDWPGDLPSSEEALGRHLDLLVDVRGRVATTPTTPTALVQAAAAEAEPELDRPTGTVDPEPTALPRRLPSSTGAALGTAVHLVVELADLAAQDADESRRLAALATAQQGLPALAGDVAARALAVARSPLVAYGVAAGRFWREVYLVMRNGKRVVEGYIDLLLEQDGELVVVDVKTDRAPTDADVATRAAHYRPQLDAYARALSTPLGREVTRRALVFARAEAALEALLPPLSAAR